MPRTKNIQATGACFVELSVGFWMYYRVDHASELVQVVSFWSTQREPPSDL